MQNGKPFKPDYQAVRKDIAAMLDAEDYDDGMSLPVICLCCQPKTPFAESLVPRGNTIAPVQAHTALFLSDWRGTLLAPTARRMVQEAQTALR